LLHPLLEASSVCRHERHAYRLYSKQDNPTPDDTGQQTVTMNSGILTTGLWTKNRISILNKTLKEILDIIQTVDLKNFC
jgi:hypothetical protein